jgi:hypothetical protein
MSYNIISEDFHTKGKIINFNNGKKESIEWQGNFDGNKGSVNIKSNNFSGESFSKTIPFTKDTLQDLFNQHISGASLENRLISDFDIDADDDYNFNEKFINLAKRTSNKNKSKSHNKNKNKNKKRKTRKYKK